MSLAIRPEQVTGVLLADGWHRVNRGTLALDAFEFVDGDGPYDGGVPGFAFLALDDGQTIAGPISSIIAVEGGRHRAP